MPKKKQTVRQPDKRTVTGAVKIKVLIGEWVDFKPDQVYHFSKKFRIKALREARFQLLKRIRKDGKPTDKYKAKILSMKNDKPKNGWAPGDTLKVHSDEIYTSRKE